MIKMVIELCKKSYDKIIEYGEMDCLEVMSAIENGKIISEEVDISMIKPEHYTKCSLECIDVMVLIFGKPNVIMFCLENAFKYMWRYEHKNGLEDLQKAKTYLDISSELSIEPTLTKDKDFNYEEFASKRNKLKDMLKKCTDRRMKNEKESKKV